MVLVVLQIFNTYDPKGVSRTTLTDPHVEYVDLRFLEGSLRLHVVTNSW